MKRVGSVLLVLAGSAVHAWGRSSTSTASPVEKVVKLLEDLKTRLSEDGTHEQQVYDKYACWCEKTTARKAEAIETAKTQLRTLGQDILSLKGKVASLSAEIEQTTLDISANEKEQAQATAIRSKENAAYMAESAELKQAISALERAIIVLRGATGGGSAALLQRGTAVAAAVRAADALEEAIMHTPDATLAKLARKGKDASTRLALVRSFAKSLSTGKAQYQPQSATIQGILSEMYSTFAADQQNADSAEADANTNFEGLMATKQTELLQLQDKLQKAEQDKAESEQMLAEATQAYDDTEAQLKADIEFFDVTKSGCSAKADEWSTRKTLRQQELDGINEALNILTSDSARELFGKAFKPGISPTLLQVQSFESAVPVKKAYQALKTQATKLHSLRLAKLAAQVRAGKVGHFDEVIKAIDTLIEELKADAASDIAKRDQCLQEYQKINSSVADYKWKIEVNQATIDKLTALITKLKDEHASTLVEIEDVKTQIADMKKQRTAENEAFLQAKKEDEEAIVLLQQAKDAIAKFYKDNGIELGKLQNFLQQGPEFKRHEDDAPDAKFSDKSHRKGESKGVISILTMLIEDLGAEIKEAQGAEEAAQLSFEEALKVAEALQTTLEEKKVNLEGAIAGRTSDKSAEEATLADNEKSLTAEEDYRKQIQPDCDFIINNFASRAEKRTAEADGLREAKEYLAGYQANPDAASLAQAPRTVATSSRNLRSIRKVAV